MWCKFKVYIILLWYINVLWYGCLCNIYYIICLQHHIIVFVQWKYMTSNQMVKTLPAMWRSGFDPWVGKISWRNDWLLAWRIPWTEKLGRLQSVESQRVGHDWVTEHSTQHDPITCILIVSGSFSVGLFLHLCFLPREVPLAFVVKLVWWCWILLIFACLESFWFLHQIWRRVLLGRVFLVVGSSLSIVACRVSVEKSADSLLGVLLYVVVFFTRLISVDSAYKWCWAVLVFVCLVLLNIVYSRFIHAVTNGRMYSFLMGEKCYILYVNLFYPFICWWSFGWFPYFGYCE